MFFFHQIENYLYAIYILHLNFIERSNYNEMF
jgi:hypothetical protein